MDYRKIYARFIESRRGALPEPGRYFERHHIVPRCLGGSDEKENFIDLTPEDHFFAHLLLAKIHGGKLWAPIAFMISGGRKNYRPTQSRKAHGWAAEAMAKAIAGAQAYQFDRQVHKLEHSDGRKWTGLQSEIPGCLGLSRSLANMLIKGRVNTAKGWRLEGSDDTDQSAENHPMHRKEIYDFCHVDGREFRGTQFDLHRVHGVAKPAASLLARRKVAVWNGWHLKGAELPRIGRAARLHKTAHG